MIARAGFLFGRAAPKIVRLRFYEWAYGRLAEEDADIGILGEFMAGLFIGGLDEPRREKAPYDLVADDGTTVEVKYSQAFTRTAAGRWRCNFLIPVHHGERAVDHFVFCQLAKPGLDPVPLRNWRFRWVPADVLAGYSRKVSNTALDARGFTPLTALGLALAEARSAGWRRDEQS